MATPAVEAEFAVMDIIGAMAIAAAPAEFCMRGERLPVAIVAGHRGVRSEQWKVGLPVVVETPLLPVHRVVTCGAVVFETALVRVVVTVAVDAGGRSVVEDLRLMTVLALRFRMFSQQREPGQAVIEENLLLPVSLVVTVLARRALSALVRIVIFVAVVAAGS